MLRRVFVLEALQRHVLAASDLQIVVGVGNQAWLCLLAVGPNLCNQPPVDDTFGPHTCLGNVLEFNSY